jgi:hypothetical protein
VTRGAVNRSVNIELGNDPQPQLYDLSALLKRIEDDGRSRLHEAR